MRTQFLPRTTSALTLPHRAPWALVQQRAGLATSRHPPPAWPERGPFFDKSVVWITRFAIASLLTARLFSPKTNPWSTIAPIVVAVHLVGSAVVGWSAIVPLPVVFGGVVCGFVGFPVYQAYQERQQSFSEKIKRFGEKLVDQPLRLEPPPVPSLRTKLETLKTRALSAEKTSNERIAEFVLTRKRTDGEPEETAVRVSVARKWPWDPWRVLFVEVKDQESEDWRRVENVEI